MKIDGGCHCGSISYAAEVDQEQVVICHCTDCQTLTGSAFRMVVPTKEDGFQLLSGTLKTYVKTGESGVRRLQTFCPECGSPIYSVSEGEGRKVYRIRVGTSRQRRELTPRRQLWCRSAQPWLADLAAIPQRQT